MSKLSAYLRHWRHPTRTDAATNSHHSVSFNPAKYAHGVQGQVCKGTQILLVERYRGLMRTGAPMPSFADVEFRNFSQNGEDGILLYIFALIGMKSRRCIEICAGDGIECNSTNLILNHGFDALLEIGRAHV